MKAKMDYEIINLAPVNFAEIVAKTKDHEEPYTDEVLQRLYAEAQNANRQAFVFIIKVEREE